MENNVINIIKGLNNDYNRIKDFVKDYPLNIYDYKKLHTASSVDKYGIGFNIDKRFSCCNKSHEVSFDTKIGYFGDSGCTNILTIHYDETFWKHFDEYLNANIKDILLYISEKYKKDCKKSISDIDNEILKLENIKKDLLSKNSNDGKE